MHASTGLVPRRFRRRLLETACARWLVPLLRCMALPLAERRNRFLVPLCVLTLLFPLPLLINHRPNFPLYASNGYAVFLPDVRFEIGRPGFSATKCVVPGVQKLIDIGVADPDAGR